MGRLTVRTAVCLVALCALPSAVRAQSPAPDLTGTIAGVVLDASSGDPIIEAGVEVLGVGAKTRTDLDGKYRVKVAPGTYELRLFAPLYQGARLRNVVVVAGKDTAANANLKPEGEAGVEVVEVVAEAKKAAEATQLLQRKAAPVVSDNIGAEEVKKSPDSDASEVVQRLPSVTISADKFVFVRGLGERYSLGVLNKSRLPSIDPDKRVVPLDVFPADFVDAINIYKTYAPNMPGDAVALVDISLKDPPDRLTYGIGLSASGNTQTTFESFDSYEGGRYDYFGFGADYRTPDDLPSSLADLGGDARQRTAAGLFRNIWSPKSESAPPDFDLNFNVGNAWGPLSFSLAGKYKNEHNSRTELIGDIPNATTRTQLTYRKSFFDTELGGIFTGAWKLSPEHKLSVRSFVQHYSEDEVQLGGGQSESSQERPIFPTLLEYEEGKLGVGQLTGAHHFNWVDVDWRTALSQTTRVLPDRRFYRYQQSEGGSAPELDSQPPSLSREFDDLEEVLTDSAVDFTVPFSTRLPMTDVWSGLPAKFQTGVAYSFRNRDYELRRFQYELESTNGLDVTARPEALLAPNNIGTNFSFSERTAPSDTFKASQEIAAAYGMIDLPIVRDRLRLITGVRLEYSYILSKGAPLVVIGEDPATFRIPINDLDPLPAVNLVYSPRDDMNLRAAWSRTVSRPEFRELQPTLIFQPPPERPLTGNPELISADIENYDLRWEWFFGDRELISISAFYKTFDNPIEQSTIKYGTLNANTFLNAESADLYGFELEGRKHFGFLAPLLRRLTSLERAIPYLTNARLIANISYIKSDATVQEDFDTRRSHSLQGQPEFVVNAALEYDQPGFLTARLLYYTVGERLDTVGISDEGVPDTIEQRRDQLDFVLIKPFTVFDTPLSAKLSVENILNDQFLQLQDDFVARRYTTGVKIGVGLSYSF